MTTAKTKTRARTAKADATTKSAPPPAAEEAPDQAPREHDERPLAAEYDVGPLAAKYRLLRAERDYKKATATTKEEADEARLLHYDEINRIQCEMTERVPENAAEIDAMLAFLGEFIDEEVSGEYWEIPNILRNLRSAVNSLS